MGIKSGRSKKGETVETDPRHAQVCGSGGKSVIMSANGSNNDVDQRGRAGLSDGETFRSHADPDVDTGESTQVDHDGTGRCEKNITNSADAPEQSNAVRERAQQGGEIIIRQPSYCCRRTSEREEMRKDNKSEEDIVTIPSRVTAVDNPSKEEQERVVASRALRPIIRNPRGLQVMRLQGRGARQRRNFHKREVLRMLSSMYSTTLLAYVSIANSRDL
ncbi:uncharacterized protein LOC120436423 isoform X2 [Oreochromis aureus]|uniref:uncharacterized protein LOC120436423 isoform X2 n=1 Tax=Oreochromis aureus TaxID=47969 RepID=UPI0019530B6A|nr:uncharacterized protein LOC120436423 isoform X2 [Oreochromis aureus]